MMLVINTLICVFFVCYGYYFTYVYPRNKERKKVLKKYLMLFLVLFFPFNILLACLAGLLQSTISFTWQEWEIVELYLRNFVLMPGAIFFYNLGVIGLFEGMLDTMITFHRVNNAENIDKYPISFAIKYKSVIVNVVRIIMCVFYGVINYILWIDEFIQ